MLMLALFIIAKIAKYRMQVFNAPILFFVPSINIYLVSAICQTLGTGNKSVNKTKNAHTTEIYNMSDTSEGYGVK